MAEQEEEHKLKTALIKLDEWIKILKGEDGTNTNPWIDLFTQIIEGVEDVEQMYENLHADNKLLKKKLETLETDDARPFTFRYLMIEKDLQEKEIEKLIGEPRGYIFEQRVNTIIWLAKELQKENEAMREFYITDYCKCNQCGNKFPPYENKYIKSQIQFGRFFDAQIEGRCYSKDSND